MNAGSPELVELLVSHGARLDIPNNKGELPLQKAGTIDHKMIIERLAKYDIS
jgi:ankyrin repeat protein